MTTPVVQESKLGTGAPMLFCSRCNNLLYPMSNNERQMLWKCLNCANEEEHDYPVAYVINLKQQKGSQREQQLLGEFATDPTARREKNKMCVVCKCDDVACFVNPLEQPTEDMSLYFACAKCKHVWVGDA
jgi:DNA-directed RNA polymerase II subunit RPB9